MVRDAGGTYLMCDTDSMAIVASKHGGLVPCNGGPHHIHDGNEAIKALSWKQVREIVDRFEKLNPYNKEIVPSSILNIVEDLNFNPKGCQRQLYGYGISAKRYALYVYDGSEVKLIKVSEHGLGLYYRPKDGRDSNCEVALWIKEGWQWILNRALGVSCQKPDWFSLPVMRRIAISTPNVMAALRRLNRDQARPYNFALSPVLVNLSNIPITLLGPFEKNSEIWRTMPYIDIHTGSVHTLNPPSLLVLAQTFEMVFFQHHRHPEYKSLAPDGSTQGSYRENPRNEAWLMSVIGMLRQQRELVPKPRVEQKKKSAESMDSAQGLSICALSSDYAALATLRSDLKPARTSSENSCGCSQAAKWPPLSSLL